MLQVPMVLKQVELLFLFIDYQARSLYEMIEQRKKRGEGREIVRDIKRRER